CEPREWYCNYRGSGTQGSQPAVDWRRGDRSMKLVALEKTTMTVAELAELAKEGPVVLTRAGRPVVAVKDLSGSDWESISLAFESEVHGPHRGIATVVSRFGRDQP